jgi:hypothetical protein
MLKLSENVESSSSKLKKIEHKMIRRLFVPGNWEYYVNIYLWFLWFHSPQIDSQWIYTKEIEWRRQEIHTKFTLKTS